MAEERLIDDDKDRKYKIRKNADGEDELYIDDDAEPEEEPVDVFIAPDDEDGEGLLTPEQLEAREKLREEAEKKRKEELKTHIGKIKELLGKDFYGAIDEAASAEEAGRNDAEFAVYKLLAYSNELTDFAHGEEILEAVEVIESSATAEQKNILKDNSQKLVGQIRELREKTRKISEENEKGKDERRPVFASRRNKALVFFGCSFAPLVIFIVLACVFGSMIYAVRDSYVNLILTIVFAALAVICFAVLVVALKKLWTAQRHVKMNESDQYTKIGREFIEKRSSLNLLERVYFSFSENDIS